jgi:LAO/AO transport system kinase
VELADRLLGGDVRALARAISMVEDRAEDLPELLAAVRGRAGAAHVVGLTGPPGSGKSTLADGVVEHWRGLDRAVGVLAVDPSSPFSGGAILGDRVRMQRHALDRGVYIRSMAARGHLGGLASAAREAIRLIDASGRHHCLLETVGVGQSELEVMLTADTVVVVTTPTSGDGVQLIKAGIMEIADIFVVNKADLPGTDRVVKELRRLVHESSRSMRWEAPVLTTIASTGEGVPELVAAVDRHLAWAAEDGELQQRRSRRLLAEVESIVAERAVERARRALRETVDTNDLGDLAGIDPYALADRILNGRSAG